MKFIDLFAGLGGFHLALKELGHKCVFACEKNPILSALYEENFDLKPEGDIQKIDEANIPNHDILCAGFPCQPFSKATPTKKRQGFDTPNQGNLFQDVVKILKAKKPRYFILENVPNIEKHNNEETWRKIQTDLRKAGYHVKGECFSPHQFKIPQNRSRFFIIGNKSGAVEFPERESDCKPDLKSYLVENPSDARKLTEDQFKCLEIWQDFLKRLPPKVKLPSSPIWSMEFGATYPYEKTAPIMLGFEELRGYSGNHGTSLKGLSDDEVLQNLPSYARGPEPFPKWKVRFIQNNRDFYKENKDWIDRWIQQNPGFFKFPQSYQKFEWNCKTEARELWNLWRFVIQFRASGVRVKKATTAPSLVTITSHIPIIGWEKRYMTLLECARLQGMEKLKLPELPSRAFTALGNAVNVEVVKRIAEALISDSDDCT